MAKGSRKWWYFFGIAAFIIYIFLSASSIPEETILKPRWITSVESNNPELSAGSESRWGFPVTLGDFSINNNSSPIPFNLGDRFGYIWDDGKYSINQIRKAYISMCDNNWAEYEAYPSSIQVNNAMGEPVITIEDPKGYPVFLDNRIFIIGTDQNSLISLGSDGKELWVHDFPAPITCIDAAGGFVLAGTLDGAVELIDSSGNQVFTPFEPGGSRLSVILGCAISRDSSRLAIISGIDDQRFLLLERSGGDGITIRPQTGVSGNTYRVIYHEFLPNGFRRPIHINFVDGDRKIAFERDGGIGIFDINSRTSTSIKLDGEILSIDNSGEGSYLFVITSQGSMQKRLIVIRYPAFIVNEAPFKSNNAFLARMDNTIYLGGDLTMASFKLEKK
ncbi:MAG: PQQ-like beta-propeller repeat protein [Treponema sp.]|nr:PQQ-like beta-propeller repeat protein [Treponema sp.]